VKENAAINSSNQHWSLADCGIVNLVVPGCIGLRVAHHGHAALQLDQQNIHAGSGLVAIRAVVNDAGNGSGLRRNGDEQKQNENWKQAQSNRICAQVHSQNASSLFQNNCVFLFTSRFRGASTSSVTKPAG
jgi:hypothetical protein